MHVNPSSDERLKSLIEWYGDGQDGSCPTAHQWQRILERPADSPVTLVNLFRLREQAEYPPDCNVREEGASGQDAFDSYAAVSMPTMEKAGGRFLFVGPYEGMFLGEEEEWDLIAIGSYPNVESFLALYTDPRYREAFAHRSAACAGQKVMVCAG